MRKILLSLFMISGCMVGSNDDATGDDDGASDDPTQQNPDPTQTRTCSLPETSTDAGTLTAAKAQQCNVPMSGGLKKWYRVAAPLTGSMDFIQIELWDGRGAFAAGAGTVVAGTYQLTGTELDPTMCGICVRGLGDKGTATQKEYFATAGTVVVTSVVPGQPISVTLTNARFQEIDATKAAVSGGCSAPVSNAKIDGTLLAAGGGGGGGGGTGGCPATIGD